MKSSLSHTLLDQSSYPRVLFFTPKGSFETNIRNESKRTCQDRSKVCGRFYGKSVTDIEPMVNLPISGIDIPRIWKVYKGLINIKFTSGPMQYFQSKKFGDFFSENRLLVMKKSNLFLVFVFLSTFFINVNCYSALVPLAGSHTGAQMYGRSSPFIAKRWV